MVAKSTALTLTTLSLIPLLLTTPTSARLPGSLSGRHAHDAPHKKAVDSASSPNENLLTGQFEKLKRAGKGMLNKSAGADSKKRRVKKRKNSCQLQAGFTASATASATATASTSVIGNQNWVGSGTASVSSAATASATTATASATAAASGGSYNSPWNLELTVAGSTFFDAWNWWSWTDPTHGTVTYVDSATGWSEGLVSINSAGHAVIKADTTKQVTGGRKSVRLHSTLVFTGGLVSLDAIHAPSGCGTWPAWWQNGPNWPVGGEIDIMEGVNSNSINQVSLHTGVGCYMTGNMNMTGTLTTGSFDNRNCASYATSNQGCGVVDSTDSTSYGSGFNSVGGGVYVMSWTKKGISVWYFPRGSIPADLAADQPVPSTWGTPVANFPSTTCDPYKYFYDHISIINLTFCGDWAAGVWSSSCAAETGYASCEDYVLNRGDMFTEAYWEIKSIKYFNSTTEL